MSDEWDVAVSTMGKTTDSGYVTLPASIARALQAEGMNRARVTVTKQGIILRPYKGVPASQRTKQSVKLPFAS